MAPKKSGSKADAKAAKNEVSAVDMEAASIEELNQKISTLEKEKNKEEEYRNYMQLERDKINAFWEITKKDLDDKRAELRNKDREIEEMEERQQVEIKVYKQKVKHLLYEHQSNIAEMKAEAESDGKLQEVEFQKERQEWNDDVQSLKQQIREQELAQQEFVKQLKLEQAKEITKLRQSFELQFRQLKEISEKKKKKMREESEVRRKMEIHEIEERKNAHINDLMTNHERAFFEIKNYYNDITHNNLDLIKTLKEDAAETKKKEVQNEKLMYEIAQENKRLSDPLNAALKEVEKLRQQLTNYGEDKQNLSRAKTRLKHARTDLKNLDWEKELLTQRLERVTKERDEMHHRHQAEIFEAQQKGSLKVMHLEKQVQILKEDVEKREAQVAEIMITANLDTNAVAQVPLPSPTPLPCPPHPASSAPHQVNAKLDEILEKKNSTIHTLQLQLLHATKAHNDLIQIYKAKLQEMGMAEEDFNFKPLPSKVSKGPTLRRTAP